MAKCEVKLAAEMLFEELLDKRNELQEKLRNAKESFEFMEVHELQEQLNEIEKLIPTITLADEMIQIAIQLIKKSRKEYLDLDHGNLTKAMYLAKLFGYPNTYFLDYGPSGRAQLVETKLLMVKERIYRQRAKIETIKREKEYS